MSGYRCIHRERIEESAAIWSVQAISAATKIGAAYKIFCASSNGSTSVYQAVENSSIIDRDVLDASALTLTKTHQLGGESINHVLGCTQISIVRNYAGEDEDAGDWIVLTLNMAGHVQIWTFAEDCWMMIDDPEEECSSTTKSKQQQVTHIVEPQCEFTVPNATGTTARLAPPRIIGSSNNYDDVVVAAVGCLDGTISVVSTGIIATRNAPQTKKEKNSSQAGTVLDSWGSQGSATPLSMCWNPTLQETIAVGRKDGLVDILSINKKNRHRILHMNGHPVRAIQYTPDGSLLIAGNDQGMLCLWDANRNSPMLVHHILNAHSSWVLDIATLADSRRFLSVGADERIHVWNVGQLGQKQPLHTFRLDSTVWTLCRLENKKQNVSRLITGSETGWSYVFSLEN